MTEQIFNLECHVMLPHFFLSCVLIDLLVLVLDFLNLCVRMCVCVCSIFFFF